MSPPRKKTTPPAKTPSPGVGTTADDLAEAGPDNVEKIRDIIFGGQMRDYDRRFSRLEERVLKETSDLRSEITRRLQELEDFAKQEFVKEYTVDEEAIVRYRRYGNRLYLPGTDSRESWEFGNLYVHEASGWKKYRTIPRGMHVFDFAEFAGRWYVATGSYFGDSETGPKVGAIYSSGIPARRRPSST